MNVLTHNDVDLSSRKLVLYTKNLLILQQSHNWLSVCKDCCDIVFENLHHPSPVALKCSGLFSDDIEFNWDFCQDERGYEDEEFRKEHAGYGMALLFMNVRTHYKYAKRLGKGNGCDFILSDKPFEDSKNFLKSNGTEYFMEVKSTSTKYGVTISLRKATKQIKVPKSYILILDLATPLLHVTANF